DDRLPDVHAGVHGDSNSPTPDVQALATEGAAVGRLDRHVRLGQTGRPLLRVALEPTKRLTKNLLFANIEFDDRIDELQTRARIEDDRLQDIVGRLEVDRTQNIGITETVDHPLDFEGENLVHVAIILNLTKMYTSRTNEVVTLR